MVKCDIKPGDRLGLPSWNEIVAAGCLMATNHTIECQLLSDGRNFALAVQDTATWRSSAFVVGVIRESVPDDKVTIPAAAIRVLLSFDHTSRIAQVIEVG